MVMAKDSGTSFENPEPGTYSAVCNKLIDLGTQEGEYQGVKNKRHQIIIGWELGEKNSKGEPFTVSGFYTVSLSDKSKLRPMLEAWRGAAFTADELMGFQMSTILGKPCMVSLVLNEKGKIKVSSISKLPKGMLPLSAQTGLIDFDLEHFKVETFDKFSDKLKDIIKKSPEYAKATKTITAPDEDGANDRNDEEVSF